MNSENHVGKNPEKYPVASGESGSVCCHATAKFLIIASVGGFLQQFLLNDVKILKEYGCEVHYASNFHNPIYTCDRELLEREGVHCHDITIEKSPKEFGRNKAAYKSVCQIIKDYGITHISCHNPLGGVIGRLAGTMVKVSSEKGTLIHPYVIYTAHGFHFYQGAPIVNWLFYYTAEKFLSRLTDCLITINQEDYRMAIRMQHLRMHLHRNREAVIEHSVGVDSNRFHPMPELNFEVRKKLHVPKDAFHIVTAAEINDNKNQEVIIRALSILNNKNIYYTICGEGPKRAALESLVKTLGLEDRIRFLGYRDDMETILSSADVFAFPSKREGLGVAAIEALLCGIPLLAADNRGTREYVTDGENGICCYRLDPDTFAKAIDRLYRNTEEQKVLSENARQSAMMFTTEVVEKTMRGVYQRALKYESEKDKRK